MINNVVYASIIIGLLSCHGVQLVAMGKMRVKFRLPELPEVQKLPEAICHIEPSAIPGFVVYSMRDAASTPDYDKIHQQFIEAVRLGGVDAVEKTLADAANNSEFDINYQDARGKTALMHATENWVCGLPGTEAAERDRIVYLIMQKGPTLTIADHDGNMVRDYIASNRAIAHDLLATKETREAIERIVKKSRKKHNPNPFMLLKNLIGKMEKSAHKSRR